MTDKPERGLLVGIDWATEKHDVCIEAPDGKVLGERAFRNDGAGLAEMADWIASHASGPPETILVAIELPRGPVVETLLERGFRVFTLNPKQLDRFRDRFTVAGAKDDRRDARVLADSLRTDPQAFRELDLDSPAILELREWSRMGDDLQQDRNRLTNRLREQLRRYYPQALQLGTDHGADWFLAVVEAIPTPEAAAKATPRSLARVLKEHRVRRLTASEMLEILRQKPVSVAPGTAEAALAHIGQLIARLRLVNGQLREAHKKLKQVCERIQEEDPGDAGRAGERRDIEILLSLPGVGWIVLATLLAEGAQPLRDRDYHAMRSLAGVAPVTRRSGKRVLVVMRQACQLRLRRAIYHWARVAAQCDPVWKERYAQRARGHTHGRACRGIADRLLGVAMAMLRDGTLYDETKLRKSA
jgi:transposase